MEESYLLQCCVAGHVQLKDGLVQFTCILADDGFEVQLAAVSASSYQTSSHSESESFCTSDGSALRAASEARVCPVKS